MLDFIAKHEIFFTWLSLISLAVFVISLFTLPMLASAIPEDYFNHDKRHPGDWKNYHPLVRISLLIGKNLLGIILLAGGVLMLFIPGQGILTILAGLVMIDYPGKFYLERRIASLPSINRGINWLRKRRNKPPIIID